MPSISEPAASSAGTVPPLSYNPGIQESLEQRDVLELVGAAPLVVSATVVRPIVLGHHRVAEPVHSVRELGEDRRVSELL